MCLGDSGSGCLAAVRSHLTAVRSHLRYPTAVRSHLCYLTAVRSHLTAVRSHLRYLTAVRSHLTAVRSHPRYLTAVRSHPRYLTAVRSHHRTGAGPRARGAAAGDIGRARPERMMAGGCGPGLNRRRWRRSGDRGARARSTGGGGNGLARAGVFKWPTSTDSHRRRAAVKLAKSPSG